MANTKPDFASKMHKLPTEEPSHNIPEMRHPSTASSNRAPSRIGKVSLNAHASPRELQKLKILAAELNMSQQDIILTALSEYFVKKGKRPIGI